MNSETSPADDRGFAGNLPLYSQPELLTHDRHGHLGIDTTRQSYAFARSIRSVPLAAPELSSAQRNYPIVFSNLEEPMLLAVLGLSENENLFVNEEGVWDPTAYIPAYVRCHPFALASRPDDQHAVVIDRAAAVISENPDQPFFEGGDLSPPIQARVDFCLSYDAHRRAAKTLCDRLTSLNLLSVQEVSFKPSEGGADQTLASYIGVDFDRLNELEAEALKGLQTDGTLGAVYAHRFSMDNWLPLLERRHRRQQASGT